MGTKEKEALLYFVYVNIVSAVRFARGSSRSPLTTIINCYLEAKKRTNYILGAIRVTLGDIELDLFSHK